MNTYKVTIESGEQIIISANNIKEAVKIVKSSISENFTIMRIENLKVGDYFQLKSFPEGHDLFKSNGCILKINAIYDTAIFTTTHLSVKTDDLIYCVKVVPPNVEYFIRGQKRIYMLNIDGEDFANFTPEDTEQLCSITMPDEVFYSLENYELEVTSKLNVYMKTDVVSKLDFKGKIEMLDIMNEKLGL